MYKNIFFDLDHTLWDYDSNAAETLHELYLQYHLQNRGIETVQAFLDGFSRINNHLWDQFDRGLIHRDVIRYERFHRILKPLGVTDYEMSLKLSTDYLTLSPRKKKLLPHAVEVLEYLSQKYLLIIITNGFDEIQSTKMNSSGITHYFKDVVTSERAGHKKPAIEIFEFALKRNRCEESETVMIGDNLSTDIAGGRNALLDTCYFNPTNKPHREIVTHEINSLHELKSLL